MKRGQADSDGDDSDRKLAPLRPQQRQRRVVDTEVKSAEDDSENNKESHLLEHQQDSLLNTIFSLRGWREEIRDEALFVQPMRSNPPSQRLRSEEVNDGTQTLSSNEKRFLPSGIRNTETRLDDKAGLDSLVAGSHASIGNLAPPAPSTRPYPRQDRPAIMSQQHFHNLGGSSPDQLSRFGEDNDIASAQTLMKQMTRGNKQGQRTMPWGFEEPSIFRQQQNMSTLNASPMLLEQLQEGSTFSFVDQNRLHQSQQIYLPMQISNQRPVMADYWSGGSYVSDLLRDQLPPPNNRADMGRIRRQYLETLASRARRDTSDVAALQPEFANTLHSTVPDYWRLLRSRNSLEETNDGGQAHLAGFSTPAEALTGLYGGNTLTSPVASSMLMLMPADAATRLLHAAQLPSFQQTSARATSEHHANYLDVLDKIKTLRRHEQRTRDLLLNYASLVQSRSELETNINPAVGSWQVPHVRFLGANAFSQHELHGTFLDGNFNGDQAALKPPSDESSLEFLSNFPATNGTSTTDYQVRGLPVLGTGVSQSVSSRSAEKRSDTTEFGRIRGEFCSKTTVGAQSPKNVQNTNNQVVDTGASSTKRGDIKHVNVSDQSEFLGEGYEPTRTIPIAIDLDSDNLSSYQCFVRKQILLFEAQEEEINCSVQGRNRPIKKGQVGILCRHCARISPRRRGRGAMYFPAKLMGLYQATQNMVTNHFTTACYLMPTEIQVKLLELKNEETSILGGGKYYWANAARVAGVEECDHGLRFAKSVGSLVIVDESQTGGPTGANTVDELKLGYLKDRSSGSDDS